jgi:hypothetical protein
LQKGSIATQKEEIENPAHGSLWARWRTGKQAMPVPLATVDGRGRAADLFISRYTPRRNWGAATECQAAMPSVGSMMLVVAMERWMMVVIWLVPTSTRLVAGFNLSPPSKEATLSGWT